MVTRFKNFDYGFKTIELASGMLDQHARAVENLVHAATAFRELHERELNITRLTRSAVDAVRFSGATQYEHAFSGVREYHSAIMGFHSFDRNMLGIRGILNDDNLLGIRGILNDNNFLGIRGILNDDNFLGIRGILNDNNFITRPFSNLISEKMLSETLNISTNVDMIDNLKIKYEELDDLIENICYEDEDETGVMGLNEYIKAILSYVESLLKVRNVVDSNTILSVLGIVITIIASLSPCNSNVTTINQTVVVENHGNNVNINIQNNLENNIIVDTGKNIEEEKKPENTTSNTNFKSIINLNFSGGEKS